jgi:hypothetical protein
MSAMTGSPESPLLAFWGWDDARSRRFLQPSACVLQPTTHPGVGALLQTKAQLPFDRPVTERSKTIFYLFQRSNPAQFRLCFLCFTVRSAEGRKLKKPRDAMIAAPQTVIVSERRSRESNDLKSDSEPWLNADY